VAHADARMALSAGLITVALAIGGPCVAAASADPGRWGSSHGNGNSHATTGNDSNSGRDGARHGQDGRSRSDDNRGERAGDRGGHGNRRANVGRHSFTIMQVPSSPATSSPR